MVRGILFLTTSKLYFARANRHFSLQRRWPAHLQEMLPKLFQCPKLLLIKLAAVRSDVLQKPTAVELSSNLVAIAEQVHSVLPDALAAGS